MSTTPLGRGAFGVVYVIWHAGERCNARIVCRFAADWRGARVAVKKLSSYIDPTLVRAVLLLGACCRQQRARSWLSLRASVR
jgi:hypothetical protein